MKRTLRSSKSHGGCATCKARRVKCDESKPTCLICRANGVDCPGYVKKLKWSSKHEMYRPPPAPPRSSPPRETQDGQQQSVDGGTAGPSNINPPMTGQMSPTIATAEPSQPATSVQDMQALNEPSYSAGGWPSFDVAGFEDFGLSDFPFVENRTPFWFHQSSHAENFPYTTPAGNRYVTSPGDQQTASHSDDQPPTIEPEDAEQDAVATTSAKRYLQTYYRMSYPGQVSGLNDEDFVNYYFHNVCTVYSCFDSPANKFRSLVADAWTSSPTIYLAIQSMAAGHLANHYPSLASLGLQKRSQAWRYLQKDLQLHRVGKIATETVLLSLLLLGPSSSWHQVSNLGMQFLFIARNLMQSYLRETSSRRAVPDLQDAEFFQEAMLRWEMVASFVDPVPFTALAGNMQLPEQHLPTGRQKIMPHPWTGVAPEIHFTLAEVGRMLRRRRTHSANLPGTPQTTGSAYFSATDDQWVQSLENFLHNIEVPDIDNIANYEDVRTPSIDLIMTADAMRFAGLLEIYDLFPDLFTRRANDDTELSGFNYRPTENTSSPQEGVAAMALHTLEIVKPIFITSAACRFLPFIMLVAGCRLQLAPGASDSDQDETLQGRYLVEARMLLLSRKYPQKPMLQMLDIIKEVWHRLDQGSTTDAHWLDVADEKGWQTLM